MRKEAILAKYRVEAQETSKKGFDLLGMKSDFYRVPINENQCRVIVSHMLGETQVSAQIMFSETEGRIPTYEECLEIKKILFEDHENVLFAMSERKEINMIGHNPYAIHMFSYNSEMPPIAKIMDIDNFKEDGHYKITKGKWGRWHFVRICGENYPDMDELKELKKKYFPQRDAAVFLIKDAVILFSNPKDGIKFNMMIMK